MENDTCELQVSGGWSPITIYQALELNPDKVKRCPECLGQVNAHQASVDGIMRAHFEHRRAHDGCSLKPRTFSGVRALHPDALA